MSCESSCPGAPRNKESIFYHSNDRVFPDIST